jgi:hypothetical protein
MTRKHFEAFAKMLREIEDKVLRKIIAEKIIPILGDDNALFDEERFRKAAKC